MIQELGWERNVDPANLRRFNFLGTPLAQFAKEMTTSLNARTIPVIGDPNLRVTKVSASCGYMSSVAIVSKLDFDVLVVGETRDWEVVEYIQDCIAAGQKKALS